MKNLPYDRAERLADLIYRAVSEAACTELSDPRLAGVSITYVRVTKDLRTARINFHLSNSDALQRKAAFKGFVSAKGLLKRKISEALDLKFVPELEFFYDEGVEAEDRIEELLKTVTSD